MNQVILVILTAAIFLSSCREFSQDPRLNFKSGVMPKTLERLINPKVPKSIEKEIVDNLKSKKGIRVGVLDNGVDYLHPGIINNINFVVENDKIVGAGTDIMGNDNWAHASKVTPILFAFGAESIDKKGRIVSPLEDPLSYIVKINDEFVSRLVKEINANPILKKSLFTRLNENNFTIADIFDFISMTKQYGDAKENKFGFSQKEYDKLKKQNRLIFKNKKTQDLDALQEYEYYTVKKQSWFITPYSGTNYVLSGYAKRIEHADEFFKVLEKVYNDFDVQYKLEGNIEKVLTFIKHRKGEKGSYKETVKSIGLAITESKMPGYLKNPIAEIFKIVRHLQTIEDIDFFTDQSNSLADKIKRFETLLKRSEKVAQKYIKGVMQSEFTLNENIATFKKIGKNSSERISRLVDIVRNNPEILRVFFGKKFDFKKLYESEIFKEYKNYALKVNHPYLEESSASVSHGTHVSGTIIAQDEDALIDPIKIQTYGTYHTKNSDMKVKMELLKDFQNFLKEDFVLKAILNNPKFGNLVDPDGLIDINNPTDKKQLKDTIYLMAKEYIVKNSSGNHLLEIDFFLQLKKAIRYIGKKKLKLVNISLGTEFDETTEVANSNDIEKSKASFIKFMEYEYFKYTVAKEIEKNAPHTIFVVAAGNSGHWVDGRSRSALPNDISSPFLRSVEKEYGIAPNNRVKNILSVGSIGRNGHLSSFTNLVISNVTYVLSVGERVRSAIKLTDTKGASDYFEEQYGKQIDGKSVFLNNSDVDKFNLLGEDIPEDETARKLKYFNATQSVDFVVGPLFGQVNKVDTAKFCMRSGICDAYYFGTSMASPHVTGIASKLINDKKDKMGLTEKEIYDHPEFSPEKIYSDLIELSSPYGEGMVENVPAFKNVKDYKRKERPPLSVDGDCDDLIKLLYK